MWLACDTLVGKGEDGDNDSNRISTCSVDLTPIPVLHMSLSLLPPQADVGEHPRSEQIGALSLLLSLSISLARTFAPSLFAREDGAPNVLET